MMYKLCDLLKEYKEKNIDNKYTPVCVGKYGIRKRDEIYKKELAKDYSKNKVIMKNTLTIGMGSNQIDIGILSDDEKYSVSPAYHTFKINNDVVNSDYLRWLFDYNNDFLSKLYMIPSARQGKTVDLPRFLLHSFNIPNKKEQENIVSNLNYIKKQIEDYSEVLIKQDELIKSRFIDLLKKEVIYEKL